VRRGKTLASPPQSAVINVAKKLPNPIDVHVGSRVRLRRMLIGMSQEKLGELLGLTFQQVQKYEKGTNRIGASRLFQIAQYLSTPVQFFFDDIASDVMSRTEGSTAGFAERDAAPYVMEFVSSAEGLELNRSYSRIVDQRIRKRILELVRCLAQDAAAGGTALPHGVASDDEEDEDDEEGEAAEASAPVD
jgi:transcriptional regulator with XRE-family HTH domain